MATGRLGSLLVRLIRSRLCPTPYIAPPLCPAPMGEKRNLHAYRGMYNQ